MKTYYADSSFIIDLMNGKDSAVEKLNSIENLVTGTPVIYEMNKFPGFDADFSQKVIELNTQDAEKAAETWRKLDSEGERIGEIDHIIAGQAINRDLVLISRDKDFKKIKELEVEFFQ